MCATGIVLSTIYANNHLLFLRNVTVLPVLCKAVLTIGLGGAEAPGPEQGGGP